MLLGFGEYAKNKRHPKRPSENTFIIPPPPPVGILTEGNDAQDKWLPKSPQKHVNERPHAFLN